VTRVDTIALICLPHNYNYSKLYLPGRRRSRSAHEQHTLVGMNRVFRSRWTAATFESRRPFFEWMERVFDQLFVNKHYNDAVKKQAALTLIRICTRGFWEQALKSATIKFS
jgi:hypothetical protein